MVKLVRCKAVWVGSLTVMAVAATVSTVRASTVDEDTERGLTEVRVGSVAYTVGDLFPAVGFSVAGGVDVCAGEVAVCGTWGRVKTGFSACAAAELAAAAAAAADRTSLNRSFTLSLKRAPPVLTTSPGCALRVADGGVEIVPNVDIGVDACDADAGEFTGDKPGAGEPAGDKLDGAFSSELAPSGAEPDDPGGDESDGGEVESDGPAHATPWPKTTAAPTPSATANPPTRPMQAAAPITPPGIDDSIPRLGKDSLMWRGTSVPKPRQKSR